MLVVYIGPLVKLLLCSRDTEARWQSSNNASESEDSLDGLVNDALSPGGLVCVRACVCGEGLHPMGHVVALTLCM